MYIVFFFFVFFCFVYDRYHHKLFAPPPLPLSLSVCFCEINTILSHFGAFFFCLSQDTTLLLSGRLSLPLSVATSMMNINCLGVRHNLKYGANYPEQMRPWWETMGRPSVSLLGLSELVVFSTEFPPSSFLQPSLPRESPLSDCDGVWWIPNAQAAFCLSLWKGAFQDVQLQSTRSRAE